jgi:hypothetical protein
MFAVDYDELPAVAIVGDGLRLPLLRREGPVDIRLHQCAGCRGLRGLLMVDVNGLRQLVGEGVQIDGAAVR